MTVLNGTRWSGGGEGSCCLRLRTLTPLYTGGVGQYGDQLHPSGILGSIRHFSCLTAAAMGDGTFEREVWGEAGEGKPHAKRVGVGVQAEGSVFKFENLPSNKVSVTDAGRTSTWYYNQAGRGVFAITLTRLGISQPHWKILLLSLRIQLMRATLGAKDQFGLGVVGLQEGEMWPAVEAVTAADIQAPPLSGPGLHNALFCQLHMPCATPLLTMRERLEGGLRWRRWLRDGFRVPGVPVGPQRTQRHYLFGALQEYGSAINVSALFANGDAPPDRAAAVRIWGAVPHTTPLPGGVGPSAALLSALINRIRNGLSSVPTTGCQNPHGSLTSWSEEWLWTYQCPGVQAGADPSRQEMAAWLNQLAGLNGATP